MNSFKINLLLNIININLNLNLKGELMMKSKRLDNVDGNQNNLTKRLEKVQGRLDEVSKEIAEMTFMGIAGGGAVEVMLKGDKTPIKIKIKEESKKELTKDTEMLLDLIVAAFNDSLKKIDEYTDREIAKITKGLPFPGLS